MSAGLMFGTGRVLLSTKLEQTAAPKGAIALAAVYGMSRSLHIQSNSINNPYLKMKLFKAVVQPKKLYPCGICGTSFVALDPREPFQSQVNGVSTPSYRNLLGLQSSTSTWCLHREEGMYPWPNPVVSGRY
jgi:hypothetical protein